MKREKVEVRLEIPMSEDDLTQMQDERFWREGMEYMRRQADQKAAEAGGYVVTDTSPEFTNPQVAAHPLLGGNWLLWASRWTVEVPESFHVPSAIAADDRG